MIIDSPGVGESDEMDEMVIHYLPQAFAFIYVINCTNAGGIKKDRVSIYRVYSRLERLNEPNELTIYVAINKKQKSRKTTYLSQKRVHVTGAEIGKS